MASKELSNPPDDGITSVNFHPSQDHLLVSSWDKTLRLYDVNKNSTVLKITQMAAVLDSAYYGDSKCVSGGIQKRVILTNIETQQDIVLGRHEYPVSCVEASISKGLIFSGSWDERLKMWDPRSPGPLFLNTKLSSKAMSISLGKRYMVVATFDRKNYIYDLADLSMPLDVRESALKQHTRCVTISNDETYYVIGSTEGRVALDYFEETNRTKNYAFKCHRNLDKINNALTVYPINAFSFHPKFGTFASGGSDGVVNIWDGNNKKKVSTVGKFPTSVSSLAFNHSGDLLCVAVSYLWEREDIEHDKDNLIVLNIKENQVNKKIK